MRKTLFILFILLFLLTPRAFAASRYWVGGGSSTNWNATANTNWSATSGGANNASVPGSADDVFFDANSGTGTANISAAITVLSVDCTGFTGTWTQGSVTLTVAGSLTLVSGMTYAPSADAQAITITGTTATITTGAKALGNFIYNKSGGTLTLGDNFTSRASVNTTFTITAGTVNLDGKTLSGNSSSNRLLIRSNTLGTASNITVSAGTFANADFRDITLNILTDLSGITGGSGNCGGNTNITFTTAANQYWVGNGGSFGDAATHWASSSGGTAGTGRMPVPQDTGIVDANSITLTSQSVTMESGRRFGSLNFTGVLNSPQWQKNSGSIECYGSINLSGVGNIANGTSGLTFMGRGAFTLTMNGLNFVGTTLNAPGGTLTLQDAFSDGYSALTITRGTFNANNFNIIAGTLSSSQSNTRTITMGSGTWSLSDTGTCWNTTTSTNLTLNANTSTISLTDTSATAKTFAGGGKIFNNISLTGGGSGAVIFTGSNTFNVFTINAPKTVNFTAGTTQTVSSFVATGTAANGITITSPTAATHTLSDSAGTNSVSYCTISYSTATGGATWNANDGTNTDGGNNTGWNFATVARRVIMIN